MCRNRFAQAPWREAPLAPPLGELLRECEAEGVQLDEWGHYEITHDTPSVSPFGLPAFNCGMIATGNHNFEKFAALCNTPEVEPRALRAIITKTIVIHFIL